MKAELYSNPVCGFRVHCAVLTLSRAGTSHVPEKVETGPWLCLWSLASGLEEVHAHTHIELSFKTFLMGSSPHLLGSFLDLFTLRNMFMTWAKHRKS